MNNILRTAIRYGLYPFLLLAVAGVIWASINYGWDYKSVYGLTTLALVITLVTIEAIFPLRQEWKMTGRSFLRDLKFIAIDIVVISLTKSAFGVLAIYYSENHDGLFTKLPGLPSVVGFLLVFELLQYGLHRYYHEGKGRFARFFGDAHLAHHLPDKVYVVMHAVFNPINALTTTIIIQAPLIILGISSEAVLVATLLIDLQSLVSHFNVDIRGGLLNYIFIGTETHRYHHSADIREAKNYGNTLAIWDIVFGTFAYKPNRVPDKLGVDNPDDFPPSNKLWQVVSYPIRNLLAN